MDDTIPAVVIVGNPVEGFNIIGPFTGAEEAGDWLASKSMEGWVVPVTGPDFFEEPGGPIEKVSDGIVTIAGEDGQRSVTIEQVQHLTRRQLVIACGGECGPQVFHLTPGVEWSRIEKELEAWPQA